MTNGRWLLHSCHKSQEMLVGVKKVSLFQPICINPKDNTHYQVYEILYVLFLWSFKFMKFYVLYFLFLLVPWVKNVTKWMCRTFEHFDSPMQKNCSGVGGEYEFSHWFNYVQVLFHNSFLQRLFQHDCDYIALKVSLFGSN